MSPVSRFSRDLDENKLVRRPEELAQHVRQVVWLTPEPKWGWNPGSREMGLYERSRDRVEIFRAVNRLAGMAEELVRGRV